MGLSRCGFLHSSIGKKQIMAVSGLGLCGFLVMHLLTNSLILIGPDTYHRATNMIGTHPLLYPAEAGLFGLFLLHICLAIKLTIENHQARPQKYYMKVQSGRGGNFASASMPYTGAIILGFLVWHIVCIKFGPQYTTSLDGMEVRDFYKLLGEHFSRPLNVLGYVFSVCALGVHVGHGLWSALQSLGLHHPRYTPKLKLISKIFGLLIAVGYSTLPIYLYLQGGK